jgi:hypothetical protein
MLVLPSKKEPLVWTKHALAKMQYYRLAPNKVKSVLNRPFRMEEGIAENTLAVMIPNKLISKNPTAVLKKPSAFNNWGRTFKHHKEEIWAMYQKRRGQIYIISAWRYPGESPVNKPLELPPDVYDDLHSFLKETD